MAKRKRGKKAHIKQPQFEDHNFSPLEAHPRSGKNLKSPYSKLENVEFSSWKDRFLPNILWAAVVGVSVDRTNYLQLFREVSENLKALPPKPKKYITHNYLGALDQKEFDFLFAPLAKNPEAIEALLELLLIESLPDLPLWKSFLPKPAKPTKGHNLAKAVALAFDHQSELATDIRWLKVIAAISNKTIHFGHGPKLAETTKEILEFPNYGEMKKVRPSIRATEMAIRPTELGQEKPKEIPNYDIEEFWVECRKKTECYTDRKYEKYTKDTASLVNGLQEISIELAKHADAVAPHTAVDAKRDAVFGLTLFGITIAMESALSPIHMLASGRILLRTIVEARITLAYLLRKDDPTIWKQFRNFGNGQAKLAFLKAVREEDLPSFIKLDELHDIANEDTWMEFQDINLGSWESLNLRQMSEFADCKDLYDKYYSWASGFTHAQWGPVRDTVFVTCLNPLHRFHRVPAPTRQMSSTLEDCCKILNEMLGDLETAYPKFSLRLDWHKQA